jgi:hypothetical protein
MGGLLISWSSLWSGGISSQLAWAMCDYLRCGWKLKKLVSVCLQACRAGKMMPDYLAQMQFGLTLGSDSVIGLVKVWLWMERSSRSRLRGPRLTAAELGSCIAEPRPV